MSKTYIQELEKKTTDRLNVLDRIGDKTKDVDEYIHEEVDVSRVDGFENKTSIINMMNPLKNVVSEWVVLDTNKRIVNRSTMTDVSWNIIDNNHIVNDTTTVVARNKIQNIIGFRIGPVPLHYFMMTQSGYLYPHLLLIKEFSQQAFTVNSATKPINFHFMFHEQAYTPQTAEQSRTVNVDNGGYYWLEQPVAKLPDTLTLTWFKGQTNIRFPFAEDYITGITYANPTIIRVNNGNDNCDYKQGSTIYIREIINQTGVDSTILTDMQRIAGYTILADAYVVGGSRFINIDFDSSAAVGTYGFFDDAFRGTATSSDENLLFPLEIIYIKEE